MNTNFISNKLRHYPERMADYLNNTPPKPITAQLQIIDKCFFECFYCDKEISKWDRLEVDDKLTSRLKELGILSVILTGGEPLMHKNFNQVVTDLSKHFKVGLVTTLYRYYEILETIPTWVKISLDSIDPVKYGKIKGVNSKVLDAVLQNMERLYKNKSPNVVLGTQMVITEDNKTLEDIESAYKRVHKFCDYLQLRPLELQEEFEYKPEVYEMLSYLKNKYPKITVSDKFHTKALYSKCYAKWVQLLISTKSDVMICCNRVHEKVANLYDPNLLDIIHKMKIDMTKCYKPCVMSVYNEYIHNIVNGQHREFV